jgi:hypothetical protein
MTVLKITAILPETAAVLLESPTCKVMLLPGSEVEFQTFGGTLLAVRTFAEAQRDALTTLCLRCEEQGETSESTLSALRLMIADAAEAARLMDQACVFIGRAVMAQDTEGKGVVQ